MIPIVFLLVFVGLMFRGLFGSVLRARRRDAPQLPHARPGLITDEQRATWRAVADRLGFRDESAGGYFRIVGIIDDVDVQLTSAERLAPTIQAASNGIPRSFSLTLAGDGLGASLARTLGSADVQIKPGSSGSDGFDARFMVTTSSPALARKIVARHTDALLPFENCSWTIRDGAVIVQAPDDAETMISVAKIAAALAHSAARIPASWSKLARALGGELEEEMTIWTWDVRLPKIRITRHGDPLHLERSFERDALLLTPAPKGDAARAAIRAAGFILDEALDAIALPPNVRADNVEPAISLVLSLQPANDATPYRA